MGNRRMKFLVGITVSALCICDLEVFPVYASADFSFEEVKEELGNDIYDENGFYITIDTDHKYHFNYYNGDNVNVKIPNHVVDIQKEAFSYGNEVNEKGRKIESIIIPRNVTKIEYGCFKECTELTTVEFQKTFPVLDEQKTLVLEASVFEGCTSLESIDLSDADLEYDRITSVGRDIFKGCTSLKEVTLSSSMTEIPGGMFEGCTSLKYIEIPESITKIDKTAFDGVEDITIYCKSDSEAVKKFQEECGRPVKVVFTDVPSFNRNPPISLGVDGIGENENGWIYRYHDDEDFNLLVSTKANGEICYSSGNPNIVTVDGTGLVSIHGVGTTYINITVKATNIFEGKSRRVPITITQRGKDPENPDDPDNPDNPNNPSNPDNPNNPDNPKPDDPNHPPQDTNTGGGNNNQNTGSGDLNSELLEDPIVEMNRIEVTYGDAPFTVSAGNENGKKVSYSSSNKKVFTVNGKGKITIKGCGLAKLKMKSGSLTKSLEIVVKPVKNSITSLKTEKRNITVKWKKDKKADGYYIYFSTDSKFKKNLKKINVPKNKTTQYTLEKLKSGKNYYVKLYSYKKSGKTIILSDSSKVMKKKVK